MPEDNQNDPRTALIQRVAAAHNLPTDWQTRMAAAEDELTDDQIRADGRAATAEAMQVRARQTPRIRTVASHEDPATTMQHRSDALFARVSGTAPTEQARTLYGRLVA